MQTIRDATILTILILIFVSVRIGPTPVAEPQGDRPEVVRTAGIGFAPAASDASTGFAPFPAGLKPAVLNLPEARFAPEAFAATVPAFKSEIREIRLAEVDSEEEAEAVFVQVVELIEGIGEVAIQEAMDRVECPQSRFKVSTSF